MLYVFTAIKKDDNNNYLLPSHCWMVKIFHVKMVWKQVKYYANVRDYYFDYYGTPPHLFFYFRMQDYLLIKSKLLEEATLYTRPSSSLLVPNTRQGINTSDRKQARLLNHRQRSADAQS